MEKLLHEQLKKWEDNGDGTYSVIIDNTEVRSTKSALMILADKIERYYIPRPRFEDGEPVPGNHKDERVSYYYVFDDGSWVLRPVHDGSDYDEINGHANEPVKLTTPKVYDADGVEIKRNDRVYPIEKKCNSDTEGYIVNHIEVDDGINSPRVYFIDDVGMSWLPARQLTHKRPVFDADGVRICKGDMVCNIETGLRGRVLIPTGEITKSWVDVDYEGVGVHLTAPSILTHREPDSLEKLRDDIMDAVDELNFTPYKGTHDRLLMIADRITAIMKTGA